MRFADCFQEGVLYIISIGLKAFPREKGSSIVKNKRKSETKKQPSEETKRKGKKEEIKDILYKGWSIVKTC